MEIIAGIMVVAGLLMNKAEPRHLQTTLSDGSVVLMRVENTDNAGRQALARVKRGMMKSGSSVDNWIE